MPREHVAGDGLTSDNDEWRVTVGWNRDGHVQVATETIPAEGTTTSVGNGKWVDLDRARINALIRLLRKARDQAFGRDE